MRFLNRITGIEGVVSQGLATFSLPTGPRYHAIKLRTFLDGDPAAAGSVVERVRVKVNEVTIWDVAVSRLLAEATLNGLTLAVGELPLFFSEPWRADKVDEQLTAWDTFGERSFKVELVIANTDDEVPLISGTSIFDYGATIVDGQRRKSIIKKLEYTFNAPTGSFDIDTLNIRYPILRLLMAAGGAINEVEVTADSVRVLEITTPANTQNLANYGLVGTAFAFPVCFDYTEQLTDFLEVSKSLNVRVASGATQAVTILQETIAPGFM